jgi:hypothetical protein
MVAVVNRPGFVEARLLGTSACWDGCFNVVRDVLDGPMVGLDVLAELLGERLRHGERPSSADTHRRRSDVTYRPADAKHAASGVMRLGSPWCARYVSATATAYSKTGPQLRTKHRSVAWCSRHGAELQRSLVIFSVSHSANRCRCDLSSPRLGKTEVVQPGL